MEGAHTKDASAHSAGEPPRRLRAAPLHRGDGVRTWVASAHGAGKGGFETRPYVTPSKPPSSSPLWRGAAAAAGWFPRRAQPPSYLPNPPL
ncbi:MAG: hypothetical protein LBM98_07695 [Oscillospiraceae bacterium]|nr:hypothetical protein [Oscillospiraceae bacterium]